MNWRQVIHNVYLEKLSGPTSLIRLSEIQNSELGDPARVIELLRSTLGHSFCEPEDLIQAEIPEAQGVGGRKRTKESMPN